MGRIFLYESKEATEENLETARRVRYPWQRDDNQTERVKTKWHAKQGDFTDETRRLTDDLGDLANDFYSTRKKEY